MGDDGRMQPGRAEERVAIRDRSMRSQKKYDRIVAQEEKSTNLMQTVLLVGLLIIIPISLGCMLLGKSQVEVLSGWLSGKGIAGMASFALFISVWVCLCLPVTAMEVVAGFVYSPGWIAWGVSLGGQLAGSILAFAIGRLILRDCLNIVFTHKISWMRPMKLVMCEKRWYYSMLIAFSYSPLYTHNYCLAVLPCSWIMFLVSSLLSSALYSLVWTQVGGLCKSLVMFIEMGEKWQLAFHTTAGELYMQVFAVIMGCTLFGLVHYAEKNLNAIDRDNGTASRQENELHSSGGTFSA